MTTTKTKTARLIWNERGQIGCELPGHAPYRGSDTWVWERWRQVTLNERIDFAADVGHAPECEVRRARATGVVSDPWFYERTADGWEIRDENRLLVALVPDAQHEREEDARRIVDRGPPGPNVQPDAEPVAERPRPRVKLVGTNGNAYAVLGRALRALREAGWSKPERDAFAAEATIGDYHQLLGTIMKHLDVE